MFHSRLIQKITKERLCSRPRREIGENSVNGDAHAADAGASATLARFPRNVFRPLLVHESTSSPSSFQYTA
jgi:hypothetical protein